MSVMHCPTCDKDIDTDFHEYDFERDLCMDCSERYEEKLEAVKHSGGKKEMTEFLVERSQRHGVER